MVITSFVPSANCHSHPHIELKYGFDWVCVTWVNGLCQMKSDSE